MVSRSRTYIYDASVRILYHLLLTTHIPLPWRRAISILISALFVRIFTFAARPAGHFYAGGISWARCTADWCDTTRHARTFAKCYATFAFFTFATASRVLFACTCLLVHLFATRGFAEAFHGQAPFCIPGALSRALRA